MNNFLQQSLNRTNVELKPPIFAPASISFRCLNRTNVELKQASARSVERRVQRLNRTNVELKHGRTQPTRPAPKRVLIEPMWN